MSVVVSFWVGVTVGFWVPAAAAVAVLARKGRLEKVYAAVVGK